MGTLTGASSPFLTESEGCRPPGSLAAEEDFVHRGRALHDPARCIFFQQNGVAMRNPMQNLESPARLAGRASRVPRSAAILACGAMVLGVAAFAPGAAPAEAIVPVPKEATMGLLQRLQHGHEWNASLEGVRTHAGDVELRYTLSASKVVLHRTRDEIVGLGTDGRFVLREEGAGRVREIEAVRGPGGVRLVYRVNSEEAQVTPAVREWLQEYLHRFRPRPSRR